MSAMRSILTLVLVLAACGPDAARGDAGGGDDAGDGGLPACSGTPLTTSGVLDVNLAVVHVTGKITLNAAALPAQPSGSLTFTETATNVSLEVPLKATYDIALTPGTYTVSYESASSLACTGALPCNSGPIKRNVALASDGVLDVDIPAITASGKITVNGGAVTSSPSSSINFTLDGGHPSTIALASTYSTTLLPGTYTVGFAANDSTCQGPLPCNAGPIKTGLALTTSGVLDLDIPAVAVSGAITVNGAALPASPAGKLTFALTGGSQTQLVLAPSYTATLLRGTYTVGFAGATPCTGVLPCNAGPIKTAVSLASNGVLDVDIPAVKVTGQVTLNGAALPAPAGNQLAFELTGGKPATIALASSYSATLLSGSYDVTFRNAGAACAGPLPCNSGPIKTGASLTSTGVLDLDIKAVKVSGKVTVNGSALPASPRGSLTFAIGHGGAATLAIAPTYATVVLAGTYTVGFGDSDSTCTGPLPCNSGPLTEGVMLASDGVLDLDIHAVTVSGAVELAGAALPDMPTTRGDVGFSLNGGSTALSTTFPKAGPASYAMTILAGKYIVVYDGNQELCDPTTIPTPPCMAQIVKGCP